MSSLLFAVVSYIGWGTSDIFGTIATRKVGSYSTTFYGYLFGLILSLFYLPFALKDLSRFTISMVVFNLFLGTIFLASSVIFFEALRIGKASIVGTIAASFTALVVIFSILFLKEQVTSIQIIAIAVIFTGTILTTLDFNEIKARKLKIDKGIMLALVTMLLWGFYFTFIKIPVHHVGWFWANFISLLPLPMLLLYAKNKGGIRNTKCCKYTSIVCQWTSGYGGEL